MNQTHTTMKTKERMRLIVVLVSFTLCALSARNSAAAQGLLDPREVQTFFDSVISDQLKNYHIPGAALSVVKNGQLLFAKGYGYADLASHKPAMADKTLFGLGSIAKLFTWTAVMQLVEQGKLDLNTDVNLYLKDFQIPATYPQPITLMHLMTHSAGFDDPYNFYTHDVGKLVPLSEFVARHMPARVRPPGKLSAYSNYGAALAGYIIEQVSGQSYEQYVEEHILKLLAMQHTTLRQPISMNLVDDLAEGYTYADGDYHVEPFVYIQTPPAGSMFTTATDMAHFMIAELEGGQFGEAHILQASAAQQMQQQLFTNDPHAGGWAYGFMEMNLNNQRLLWHRGDTPLFHSLLVLWPDQRLGLFVSYNGADGSQALLSLLQTFADHYFPVSSLTPLQSTAGYSQRLDRYIGHYRPVPRASATFEKARFFVQNQVDVSLDRDGALLLTGLGDPARLIEVEPQVFRLPLIAGRPNRAGEVVFREDNTGCVTHFFLANEPLAVYEKIDWYETSAFNVILLGTCILLFASMLLTRIVSRLDYGGSGRPCFAYRLLRCLSALNLVFLIGILITLSRQYVTTHEIIPFLMPLLMMALIATGLTIGVAAATFLVWKGRYWSLTARIHYTLVALAAAAFVWWLNYWNLLGLRLE